MVTLVVATTTDPASIGPASALLAMPGWQPGLSFEGITSFVNGDVRLLQHDKGIVEEDHLDKRWEQASSEVVHELIFLSKHTAVSNRPALTIHPIDYVGSYSSWTRDKYTNNVCGDCFPICVSGSFSYYSRHES